ncbi:hypothetical protein SAMN04488109_3811 [Chryseolinea serpens]|uniref:Uncharacterized protein n=1 Tax=Chryseolinea serpens TaxID=947013 RepID=A0A1M5S8I7_9BACT|nr:hypothetical protein [Chryseolinea serpens]SHH34952.1 hypothetical protein SAMN04488109_3811 [Chryseolinea serpens]
MYAFVLWFHSLFRWAVLTGLLYALYRAYRGYRLQLDFTNHDESVRHWTATLAHIQLTAGFYLYLISPFVKAYFSANPSADSTEGTFFGWIHITCMLVAVVMITVGSAWTKRKVSSRDKFRTMLGWFGVGLLVILLAVPWPFLPWAHRPYIRPF